VEARAYEHPGTDHGEHAGPEAWLTVPEAATLSDLVFAGAALHDAVERADTEVAGDTTRPAALLRCFPEAVRYPAPQDPGRRTRVAGPRFT
jgi:hypothetical protein